MQLNGSQIFVEVLCEQGVDTIFGYPGGAVLNLYDELYKNAGRITHVLTAHEQGAAHAADGYARSTGGARGPVHLLTMPAPAGGRQANSILTRHTMREIDAATISAAVAKLAVQACCHLPADVRDAFRQRLDKEPSPVGRNILEQLLENADIAARDDIPICQDTGLAVVFAEVGQDVHITGGDFEAAIHEGVRRGYVDGYLRKSCVAEPLFERKNTGDNTPAVIHTRIVPGDGLTLRLAPKGAGSENKSVVKMLVPADGIEGVRKVVLDAVLAAGPNSCPPMVVGVGLGGTMEVAALCAKRAAARDLESRNPDPRYAAFEDELLELINRTGIGPQGLGGETTALKVHVEWAPTHIASLPVAVNINCHAARHAEVRL